MRTVVVVRGASYYVHTSGGQGLPGEKGDPGSAGDAFPTRAALAAFVGATDQDDAYVTEAKAFGKFVFYSVASYLAATGKSLTAQVAIDSTKGIFVPPASDTTGASGAWVRQFDGPIMVDWFLVTPGAFTTSAIIQKIESLRDAGQGVQFGVGNYSIGNVTIGKHGHWRGLGKTTVITHGGTNIQSTFIVSANGGTRFSHMRLTGLSTPSNAGAPFPIMVWADPAGTAAELYDFEFDHLWFDGCDTGIRALYRGIGPTNDIPGTTWFTPNRIHIHDCVFEDVLYQCIIPECRDVVVERCRFKLTSKPGGGYRPFSHFVRALGCDRVTVRDCRFESPFDYVNILCQLGGVDNGLSNDAFRMASNLTIENNHFNGGYLKIDDSANRLLIRSNHFWNNPQSTTDTPDALIFIGSSAVPVFFGKVFIEDNYAVGYPKSITFQNTAAHQISIKRNTFIGNKKTGGFADMAPMSFLINDGAKLQDGVTQIPAPVLLEIEDNDVFSNPSATGYLATFTGNWTGMHFRYSGNKMAERPYASANQLFAPGTGDPKISISKTSAFIPWSTLTADLSEDVVGDNVAMPAGFYAALMASSFFRPEQTVGAYPPTWA